MIMSARHIKGDSLAGDQDHVPGISSAPDRCVAVTLARARRHISIFQPEMWLVVEDSELVLVALRVGVGVGGVSALFDGVRCRSELWTDEDALMCSTGLRTFEVTEVDNVVNLVVAVGVELDAVDDDSDLLDEATHFAGFRDGLSAVELFDGKLSCPVDSDV